VKTIVHLKGSIDVSLISLLVREKEKENRADVVAGGRSEGKKVKKGGCRLQRRPRKKTERGERERAPESRKREGGASKKHQMPVANAILICVEEDVEKGVSAPSRDQKTLSCAAVHRKYVGKDILIARQRQAIQGNTQGGDFAAAPEKRRDVANQFKGKAQRKKKGGSFPPTERPTEKRSEKDPAPLKQVSQP